jgi:hypothetical protein
VTNQLTTAGLPTDYLDEKKLLLTIAKLEARIRERFPDASLAGVCQQLYLVARESTGIAQSITRPHWLLRLLQLGGVITVLLLLGWQFSQVQWQAGIAASFSEFMQGTEALVSELFFVGTAMVFLISLENRRKRNAVIAAVNRLRSIAHVIDMHQLTKDPTVWGDNNTPLRTSPTRIINPFLLVRYLDYCAEMLAITSKIGFIYINTFANYGLKTG